MCVSIVTLNIHNYCAIQTLKTHTGGATSLCTKFELYLEEDLEDEDSESVSGAAMRKVILHLQKLIITLVKTCQLIMFHRSTRFCFWYFYKMR